MTGRWELTQEQWAVAEPVLRPQRREDNRGRPWHDTRAVLQGVLRMLSSGASCRRRNRPFPTCHRRSQQWIRSGKLEEATRWLARHLHERGKLNLEEAFVDAISASAKRGFAVGPTRRGKGTEIVTVAAGNNLQLAISVQSASPAECQLVEEVLAGSCLEQLRARLIGDRAYNSDGLDHKLEQDYGIGLIARNRCKRSKTQDGRKLRRYRKL